MTPANAMYGHRAILNAYLGVDVDQPVLGVLQHGWHFGSDRQGVVQARWVPYLVWGDRHILTDGTRCTPIGAPFLYHPRVRAGVAEAPVDRVLAMPYHAFGEDPDGTHVAYAEHLVGLRSEASSVTVCLHPHEYDSPIRAIYEGRGFATATNGVGASARFLENLLDLLEAHGTVTTNRMSTGLLYGAQLGRRIVIDGPFARSEDRSGLPASREEQQALYEREFPGLADGLEGDGARALAARELGAGYVLAPDALGRVLGAHGLRQATARTLRSANRVRRWRTARAAA